MRMGSMVGDSSGLVYLASCLAPPLAGELPHTRDAGEIHRIILRQHGEAEAVELLVKAVREDAALVRRTIAIEVGKPVITRSLGDRGINRFGWYEISIAKAEIVARVVASITRKPSGMTSLPMPSPAMTAILCLLI